MLIPIPGGAWVLFTAKAGGRKSSPEPLNPRLSAGAWQGLWLVDLGLLNSLAFSLG